MSFNSALSNVPPDTVYAYVPDGKSIEAIICWHSDPSPSSDAFALVSKGLPAELPRHDAVDLDEKIQGLIKKGHLTPFTEEFAELENFFHLRDPRPWINHDYAVWHHMGEHNSLPSLVPGQVYGHYIDGKVPPDQMSAPPVTLALEELAELLTRGNVVIVKCLHDATDPLEVTFCDMRLVLSQLASA